MHHPKDKQKDKQKSKKAAPGQADMKMHGHAKTANTGEARNKTQPNKDESEKDQDSVDSDMRENMGSGKRQDDN